VEVKPSQWEFMLVDGQQYLCSQGLSIGEALDSFFNETNYSQSDIVLLIDRSKDSVGHQRAVTKHNRELIKALEEAIGWNWLSHVDALDGNKSSTLIPDNVLKQVGQALGRDLQVERG